MISWGISRSHCSVMINRSNRRYMKSPLTWSKHTPLLQVSRPVHWLPVVIKRKKPISELFFTTRILMPNIHMKMCFSKVPFYANSISHERFCPRTRLLSILTYKHYLQYMKKKTAYDTLRYGLGNSLLHDERKGNVPQIFFSKQLSSTVRILLVARFIGDQLLRPLSEF